MNIFSLILIIVFGFIVAAIAKHKGLILEKGEKKVKGSHKMKYFTWWFCGAALFLVSIIYVLVIPSED